MQTTRHTQTNSKSEQAKRRNKNEPRKERRKEEEEEEATKRDKIKQEGGDFPNRQGPRQEALCQRLLPDLERGAHEP